MIFLYKNIAGNLFIARLDSCAVLACYKPYVSVDSQICCDYRAYGVLCNTAYYVLDAVRKQYIRQIYKQRALPRILPQRNAQEGGPNAVNAHRGLCTDDFAGHLKNNLNLAIKATVEIASYSELAKAANKAKIAKKYLMIDTRHH